MGPQQKRKLRRRPQMLLRKMSRTRKRTRLHHPRGSCRRSLSPLRVSELSMCFTHRCHSSFLEEEVLATASCGGRVIVRIRLLGGLLKESARLLLHYISRTFHTRCRLMRVELSSMLALGDSSLISSHK